MMKQDIGLKFYHYGDLEEVLQKGTDIGAENLIGYISFLLLLFLKDKFMNIGVSVLPIAIVFVIYKIILRVLTMYTKINIYYPKVDTSSYFYKTYGFILKSTKYMTISFSISLVYAIYEESFEYVLQNIEISNLYVELAFILITIYICRIHLFKRYITGIEYCSLAKKVKSNVNYKLSNIELNRRIMNLKCNEINCVSKNNTKEVVQEHKIEKNNNIKDFKEEQIKSNSVVRRKARDIDIDVDID